LSLSDIGTVYGKELRELVRDRRMLVMFIIMPSLSFPLLLYFAVHVVAFHEEIKTHTTVKVALAGQASSLLPYKSAFASLAIVDSAGPGQIGDLKSGKLDAIVRVEHGLGDVVAKQGQSDGEPSPVQPDSQAPKGLSDAGAQKDPGAQKGQPGAVAQNKPVVEVQVRNLVADADTVTAVRDALTEVQSLVVDQHLRDHGILDSWLHLPIKHLRLASSRSRLNEVLSLGLPFSLVYLVLIVTATPALDMVTGEKERGTLTALLSTVISRTDIMLGKLAVVSTVGIVVVLLTLATVSFSMRYWGGQQIRVVAPVMAMICTAVLLTPLILFLSASALWLSAYARNFQQGQAYLTVCFLINLVLCALGAMPIANVPPVLYLVPVTNICLCLRQCFEGSYQWAQIGLTLGSSTVYAVYICWLASGQLERENVVFSVQAPPRLRKDFKRAVAGLYVLEFILMFYVGQVWQAGSVLLGIAASQWLLIAPGAVLTPKFLKLPLRETLSIRPCSWRVAIGALLLAPATVLICAGVAQLQEFVLPMPELFEKTLTAYVVPKDKPVWEILLIVALTPAICEELMFRGAIMGLLRKSMKPLALCVWVGLLFGIFHLSAYRVVPTTLLGILLAALVWRSGSIYPAMLLHAAHNALTTCMVIYSVNLTPAVILWCVPVVLVGALLVGSGLKTAKTAGEMTPEQASVQPSQLSVKSEAVDPHDPA